MSRSRRQSPFIGHTTAPSDKPWKQQHSRKLRRAIHKTLSQTDDGEAVPKSKFAKGNADWDGLKDGKQRLDDPNSRYLRK
jgi:hypothetical protein